MSTFPQPEPGNFSSPHQDPFANEDLLVSAVGIEYAVTVLEPRARHLNRRLLDLFGPHPSSSDGSWVFISEDPEGTFRFSIEPIDIHHVFRLESLFDTVRDLLGEHEVAGRFGARPVDDIGARLVGDASALRNVPPIHVRIERRS